MKTRPGALTVAVLVAVLVAMIGRIAPAQTPAAVPSAATVSGVVRDSISRAPLTGAIVQLVSADPGAQFARSTVSDAIGRFTFSDVPDGRYLIGFLHPLLDSLGVEAPLRDVVVRGGDPAVADLAIPSPGRLRDAICSLAPVRSPGMSPPTAVLLGVVRDARTGERATGVTVEAEWMELTVSKAGINRHRPRVVVTTNDDGWFALCNVPNAGSLFLSAHRGQDSTDVVELEVASSGFLRRELFLGRAGRNGGQLSGTVFATEGARPLAGAQVRINETAQARTNERGEWTISNAPLGTRQVEVRALGFYPERRAVDVIAGAQPIRTELTTFRAVLEAVRITVAKSADRNHSGFEERRRTGLGKYLTAADIERRGAIVTTDVFRAISGVRIERDAESFDSQVLVRGATSDWCAPTIIVNGMRMSLVTAADLDTMMRPREIASVEIYTGISTPVQFQQGLSGCGSIVIWLK